MYIYCGFHCLTRRSETSLEKHAANRKRQWRYRIGDYRLICHIEDDKLIILALSVGHRREVYEDR
ncbi:MAG: type II toxin-antitoxin system RelE/ParE family toxin [Erysipelotrichaceae bacterium]|nr:type II toxin-antitoxin system RelE/ParE family toxin [Erysipelotrichaceae bacterium]